MAVPSAAAVLDPVLAPADRVRVLALRALGPVGRRLVAHREARVAVGACAGVVSALILTVVAPLWLLALGPIALGVPHLLADVRYLVLRPGLHRRPELWAGIGVPLLGLVLGFGSAVGLAAAAGAAVAARGRLGRRAAVFAGAVALVALAAWAREWTTFVIVHGHNAVAIALWAAWRSRRERLHWVPIGLFAAVIAMLLTGVFDDLAAWAMVSSPIPPGLGYARNAAWLAPGIDGPLALRLVLSFAFAQSVHYAVWLRLVPEDDRDRETARTLRRTVRELVADVGAVGAAATVLVAVAIAAWAVADLAAARTGYLHLALFHGYLEIAVAALWLAEGRPRC